MIGPHGIDVGGEKHLDTVKEMNDDGRYCVFAPNHLKPTQWWRTTSALADDHPHLQRVLRERNISSRVLFRGDCDMPIGDDPVRAAMYHAHRHAMSAVGRVLSGGGMPVYINEHEPELASSLNSKNARAILGALSTSNMTIYPYGNWFAPGEQEFSVETDLDGDRFIQKDDFRRWRAGLKKGFIGMARRTGSPIVPTYMDHVSNAAWSVRFGEPIDPDGAAIAVARRYVETMAALKRETQDNYQN